MSKNFEISTIDDGNVALTWESTNSPVKLTVDPNNNLGAMVELTDTDLLMMAAVMIRMVAQRRLS